MIVLGIVHKQETKIKKKLRIKIESNDLNYTFKGTNQVKLVYDVRGIR